MTHRLQRYFKYDHLPKHLQTRSKLCHDLAEAIIHDSDVVDEAEATVALRKLLEAKDAYVRSTIPEQKES